MSEFSQCRKQFKILTEQRLLPPKIFMKLRYIQSSVLNEQNQQQYFNKLPDFQKQSLEQMNKQTQKAMFMGIIGCFAIAEKREHFKNIRAKVKKSSSFRDGANCFLNCLGNRLNVIKIKEKDIIWKEFELSKLKIDKIYKKIKKSKFSFCIEFQKTEYEMKFQEQGPCAKIHSLLQNLIRQHSTGGNIEIIRYNLQQQTQPQNVQEQRIDIIDDKDQTQQLIMIQEKDHLVKLKQKIQMLLQEFQDKFKLYRNIQNGKIQINSCNNSAKIIIFMEKCKLKQLIECFICLEGWNTNIQNFKIIKKLRVNSYLAYIKLKKTSIWNTQKQGYATISYLKDCFCYAQMRNSLQNVQNEFNNDQFERSSTVCLSKHYICINGVEANEQGNSANMKFNMVAEFTEMEDKDHKILISVISNLDYSSYDIFTKKFEVNLGILKDIPFLNVYYKERTIQNNSLQLFQINRCICSIKPRKLQIIKQDEERSMSSRKGSAVIQNLQFQQLGEKGQNSITDSQIIQIIKDQLKQIKNQKIIQVIKKRLYESYYLKHRFQLTQKDEQYKKSDYKLNADTDFLFQNGRWKITKDESYVFANQQQLNIQKGVLKLVIKQITSNILAGKSIMTMSLPVEIFDKKSLLAGAADLLGFLPYYLNKAASTDSVIEQIKCVCGAFMFMFACQPKISKPFNPILGETLQAYLGGIPLFIEQISHHPPISSIYMKTNQFECHGCFQLHVDMGLNAAYSKSYGFYYVKIFATNTHFIIKLPDLEFCGVMFGDRSLKAVGKSFVFETSTDTYLQYSIGKSRKKMYQYSNKLKDADIGGGIFKVTKDYSKFLKNFDGKKSVEGAKPEDIIEKYSQISGKWYGDLFFDNIEYKSLKNGPFPIRPERPEILLPSDCLFREDIIYKVWGDNKKSNEQKQILQNLQRKDRKLREKYQK